MAALSKAHDVPTTAASGLAPPNSANAGPPSSLRRHASPNGRLAYVRHGSSSSIGSNGPSPLGRDMQVYDEPSSEVDAAGETEGDDPSGLSTDERASPRKRDRAQLPHLGVKRRSPQLGVAQYLARGLSMSSTDMDGMDGDEDDDDFDFEAKLSQIRPLSSSSDASSSIGSFEFLKNAPIGAPLVSASTSNSSSGPSSGPSSESPFEKDPTTPRPGQTLNGASSSGFPRPPPRSASATVRRTGAVQNASSGGWKFPTREDSAGAMSSPLASSGYGLRSAPLAASTSAAPPSRNGSFAALSNAASSAPSSRPSSPGRYRSRGPGPPLARTESSDDAFGSEVARPFRTAMLDSPTSAASLAAPGGATTASQGPASGLAKVIEERSGSPPPAPMSPDALLEHVRQMKDEAFSRRNDHFVPQASLSAAHASLNGHARTGSGASATSDENPYGGTSSPRPRHGAQLSVASMASTTTGDPDGDSVQPAPPRMGAETLDLSHRRIADLSLPIVQELAEFVERLALGYNYLPILPSHFSLLGETLRYLNLRGNHMEIFPEVLTRMPSIEILDVSRNKIRAMPKRPGTLDRLRVLSVSQNRIRRLPNYISTLHQLRVFKLDHNPIVWPPRDVTTFVETPPPPRGTQGSENGSTGTSAMGTWLRGMQEWMRKNPHVRAPASKPGSTGGSLYASDDIDSRVDHDLRERSRHKASDSIEDSPTIPQEATHRSPLPYSPSLLSPHAAVLRSPLASDDSTVTGRHVRNASASIVGGTPEIRKRPELRLKKSLPDLRRNHGDIMVERRAELDAFRPAGNMPLPPIGSPFLSPDPGTATSGQPSPAISTSQKAESTARSPASGSVRFNEMDVQGHERNSSRRTGGQERMQGDRNSGAYFRRLSMLPASTISKQVPDSLLKLIDAIRGVLFSLSQIYAALKQFVVFASYDRLPDAISRVMDSADDSMGKLINALDRFDAFTRRGSPDGQVVRLVLETCRENVAVFGKLVSVLGIQLRVLVSSSDVRYSRTLLLNLYGSAVEIALAWSTITPLIPEATKILHPQGTPTGHAAVRLQPPTPSPTPDATPSPTKAAFGAAVAPTSTARPILMSPPPGPRPKARRHAGSFSVEDVQMGAVLPPASASFGSFDIPDVPSPPPSMASLMRGTDGSPLSAPPGGRPAGRVNRGGNAVPPLGLQLPAMLAESSNASAIPPSPFGPPPSLPASAIEPSSGSEYPFGRGSESKSLLAPRSALPLQGSRSVTPNALVSAAPGASRTDQDFLDMADVTTNIAVSVSTLLLESLSRAVSESDARMGTSASAAALASNKKARELMELCESELEVTRRLRLSLTRVKGLGGGEDGMRPRSPNYAPVESRRLYEDSTAFVKIIIQMANLAKAATLEYPLAKPVREGLGQLTKATKELATLLAVSSFKPGPAALHGLGVTNMDGGA